MAKPTIKTIAQAAGVSTATVSKALNDMPDISESSKARIRQIAQEMGYTINANARQLASGHSYAIGMIVPDIAQHATAEIFKAAYERLARAGYSIYLSNSGLNEQQEIECVNQMIQKRVAALIVMPISMQTKHIEDLVRDFFPLIYIGGGVYTSAQNTVVCDDFAGGRLAARYLLRAGHKECTVLTCGRPASALHERMRGFVDYMQRHGHKVHVRNSNALWGSEEVGLRLARETVEKGVLTSGIFATEDSIALGAMAFVQKAGLRIPEDISIVGYEDTPCAALELVQLTSVRSPKKEIGICAGDMAIALVEGSGDITRKIMLEPQLIKRKSVLSIG